MDNMREKIVKLLCEASSLSVDAELFEDSSYAQQLEIEADFLIANGVTIPVRCKDCKHRVLDTVNGEDWCNHTLGLCSEVYATDFCSYGERRLDDN